MSVYSIVVFLHIVGAVGLFIAIGLEWVGLLRLRQAATVEAAREWIAVSGRLGPVFGVSTVLILLAGLYLVITNWGWGIGWVEVALLGTIVFAVLGSAFNGPRGARLDRALSGQRGPISPDLRRQLNDPVLWTSVTTMATGAIGIVFLMATKPGFPGSIVTMIVAIAIGGVASLPGRQLAATGAAADREEQDVELTGA